MTICNNVEDIIALGAALRAAAVVSEAAMTAIPAGTDVRTEGELIDAAAAPVFAIAEQILAIPASNKNELAVKARAVAWMDGCYWKTLEEAE